MAAKAISYAEVNLGVHTVFYQAERLSGELQDLNSQLTLEQKNRRLISESILDREADLLGELRGIHSELSATALDGRFKIEKRKDPELQKLRSDLAGAQWTVDWYENEIRSKESAQRVFVARMHQLGGYLTFLAAAKQLSQEESVESGKSVESGDQS